MGLEIKVAATLSRRGFKNRQRLNEAIGDRLIYTWEMAQPPSVKAWLLCRSAPCGGCEADSCPVGLYMPFHPVGVYILFGVSRGNHL